MGEDFGPVVGGLGFDVVKFARDHGPVTIVDEVLDGRFDLRDVEVLYLTDADDFVSAAPEVTEVHARAGDDDISAWQALSGVTLHGGSGDDLLWGSPRDDSLYGGSGSDYADGMQGNDGCWGWESTAHCEYPNANPTVDIPASSSEVTGCGPFPISGRFDYGVPGHPSAFTPVEWTQVMTTSGGNASFGDDHSSATEVAFTKNGRYTLRLTVTNSGGLSSYDQIMIIVSHCNTRPPE